MTKFLHALLTGGLMAIGLATSMATSSAQTVPSSPVAPASETDVSELKERAAAFWAARVTGDADTQWKLLEPRGRGRLTAQEYAGAPTGGRFLAYQVESATVKGLFATVKVKLLVQQILPMGGPNRSLPPQAVVVEDGWVRIGGVWYRRMDDGQKATSEAKEP